jgi:2-furoyl-CoA dehydrogenase large subunit
LHERLVYAEDGGFLTGSLLDYALPTALMLPELEILHQETQSPVTPLGAKGVAEGNSMSTPVCIANAVADALGVAEVSLPLTPERLLEMVRRQGQ